MFRRSSAAPTDQIHARSHKLPRIAGHVLGRAEIDISPFYGAGNSCVRLCDDWQGGKRPYTFHGIEHGNRANAAIATNHICAPLRQAWNKNLWRRTVQSVAVFIDRESGHDRQIGFYLVPRLVGLMEFFLL